MFNLKTIATLFPAFTTILVHGSGQGGRMSAGSLDHFWADKIVKTIIPLDAYMVEIIVEGE